MTELRILDRTGDLKLTWDNSSEPERAKARAEVAKLKEAGYLFFLIDGTPADEITAGKGELNARIISADELTESPSDSTADTAAPDTEAPTTAKRKGRPKGVPNKPRQAVAVRPMRGG